jgi:hypothetical protein
LQSEKSTVAQALLQSSSSSHKDGQTETQRSPAKKSANSSPDKPGESQERKAECDVSGVLNNSIVDFKKE